MKFFERFLRRELDAGDIYTYIENWHKSGTTQPVHQYLGFDL